ncbi:cholesterol transporter ABCA5 isoform X1 [Pleurodeles waltl]
MASVLVKDAKVWRQTKALLYKNYLVKCRTKKTSIQEILFPLFLLLLLMFLSLMHPNKHYNAMPSTILGSLHEYLTSDLTLGYMPVNNLTSRIMNLMYSDCLSRDIVIEEFASEEDMREASISNQGKFVGLVFNDAMSYQLRFFPDSVPASVVFTDSRANCYSLECDAATYLHSEFTSFQACIDSSIIKLKTNYSVWDELKSTKVILMGEPAVMEIDTFPRAIILIYLVMAFSPFGYYVAAHVVAEKEKKLKEFLKIMGLHDTAFWLSWVLLYSSFILIMSLLMAVIVTVFSPFPKSNYFLIFALFFLYGISLIFFALMLTPFFKKAKHVGVVEFLATLVFGCIGLLIVLVEDFPKPYVWLLSPFCHCTFLIGIAQVLHLEDYETGALFSNLKEGPCPLIITFIFLVVDSTIYLLLAIYLDQVLPGEYGLRRSPLFFFKPSYWSKKRRYYSELDESTLNRNLSISEMAEPVSEEFQGKAAIRITGVQKTFRKKDENVEALRGLSFDIYEGQITALLGHSGTGKTTLMNILCGLCPASDGGATIFGHKISEFEEMVEVRKMIGICPQTDILFDVLTVEENLSVFASVKGVDHRLIQQEVHKVLQDLDMHAVKDNQAIKLSGGQKRKLSVGVAVLGNPKVLLLDEPTAGMDPCSRHVVWKLLKHRKADRVTVLSTHFMDEADILADRKAVISQGMLKCIGSSLFLKTKWGVGYRLSLDINKICDVEAVTSLIRGHTAGSKLLQQHEHELVFTLPFKDMDKFSGLFSDLDGHSDLGVISYGVSMTTLEDVFLKLEVEAEIDQADYSVFNQQHTEEDLDRKSLGEMEQSLLLLSESKANTVSSPALWRQQAATVARFHFLNLKRESKSVRVVLLLLLIFIAVQVFMFLVHRYFKSSVGPVKLSPDLYFVMPGQKSNRLLTSLLVQNSTGSTIDDIINSLRSQKIAVELINGSDYIAISPHNAALNVLYSEKSYTFEAVFNSTMVHSLPVLVNVISNLVLDSLNSTESIHVWSNPFFQEITETIFKLELYFQAALLGIIVTGMPPYFAMENADCHKMKAYTQLKMAGLYPSAYWVGQAVVDLPLFFLILVLMMGSLFAFHYGVYFYADKFVAVVFCLLGYVPAVILFTYTVSFTYKNVQNTQEFWSFIFSVTALIAVVITEVTYFIGNDLITTVLHDLFSVFIPIYPLVGCLICFIKISWKGSQNHENHSSPWSRLFIAVISPYLQCLLLLFLLRYLEMKNNGRATRVDPLFRTCTKKTKPLRFSEVPNDEDDDVQAERARVGEMITCKNCEEKPAILVCGLYKEYDEKRHFFLGRKIKKWTTNNVSLSVKKGEILGLLGPNGAGKSTFINMLVGDTDPTAGQVLMGEYSQTEGNNPVNFVGYCPQTNPLWPEITLQEHLEIFGSIKGMTASDLKDVIKRVTSALDLKEHLQKPSKKLSAGIKRKLCFALSMLGNPHIVLLDEPSTGMDPKAKQQMWRAIRTAFKSKERSAILTTHYMEEADAVCDRVAIMVSGQLRCIGSVQHLKSKFGRKYFLDMKLREVSESQKVELLHREIEHIFPHASRQESFASILSYKIPREDVQSLSLAFSRLEEAKHAFDIEEYSFSQSTLEQVFVEFAKEQEVEEDDFATLNSTLWWERRQEDRVIF